MFLYIKYNQANTTISFYSVSNIFINTKRHNYAANEIGRRLWVIKCIW